MFMKQIIERGRKIPFDQWSEDLRVREMPSTSERRSARSSAPPAL